VCGLGLAPAKFDAIVGVVSPREGGCNLHQLGGGGRRKHKQELQMHCGMG
jgi:hypothetical protein